MPKLKRKSKEQRLSDAKTMRKSQNTEKTSSQGITDPLVASENGHEEQVSLSNEQRSQSRARKQSFSDTNIEPASDVPSLLGASISAIYPTFVHVRDNAEGSGNEFSMNMSSTPKKTERLSKDRKKKIIKQKIDG